jgi:NAD(P)-dependent dehydrogenase (short-subunit alcohol dehydrogenase family)
MDMTYNSVPMYWVCPPHSPESLFVHSFLGHFYFTKLLLPILLSTAKSSPDHTTRVINTSSMGHGYASGIDFDTLKDGRKRKKLGTYALYAQSKFVRFFLLYR